MFWMLVPPLVLAVGGFVYMKRKPDPVVRLNVYFATISYKSPNGAGFGTVPVIAANEEQANALVVRDFQQKAPGRTMDTLKVSILSEDMLEKVMESRREKP